MAISMMGFEKGEWVYRFMFIWIFLEVEVNSFIYNLF